MIGYDENPAPEKPSTEEQTKPTEGKEEKRNDKTHTRRL